MSFQFWGVTQTLSLENSAIHFKLTHFQNLFQNSTEDFNHRLVFFPFIELHHQSNKKLSLSKITLDYQKSLKDRIKIYKTAFLIFFADTTLKIIRSSLFEQLSS